LKKRREKKKEKESWGEEKQEKKKERRSFEGGEMKKIGELMFFMIRGKEVIIKKVGG
jgi:hypothetical protein